MLILQIPNCEVPIQTTAPGLEQETWPAVQLPPVEGVPEGAGADKAAGVEDPMAEEAPAGAEGAAVPAMVCSVVIVRMPLEGLACPLG